MHKALEALLYKRKIGVGIQQSTDDPSTFDKRYEWVSYHFVHAGSHNGCQPVNYFVLGISELLIKQFMIDVLCYARTLDDKW